jgi:catechol 2,3-dioxygenase-like lactoylglutathione lyase family enzyme
MIKANGIHHIAIMAGSIKEHIAFFSDVLGCKLSAIFDMHGVPGGVHAFLHMADDSYFSVVELPGVKDIPIELGATHAGSGAGVSAPGTMQHLAFKVSSVEDLLAIRDRIRKRGINVLGPMDHGMCHSIYFAGPDNLALEVATSSKEIDQRYWIDPAVVEKVGITGEELARYKAPDPYSGEGGTVKQPPYDPEKPHLAFPPAAYQKMLATPDEVLLAVTRFDQPVPAEN